MKDSFFLDVESPLGTQGFPVNGEDAKLAISALLRKKELSLNTRCGERGWCDGCLVELRAGHAENLATGEIIGVSSSPVVIRACEHRLCKEDASLFIPGRSFLAHEPQIVSEFKLRIPWAKAPLVSGGGLGAAIDIGTTTVAMVLVDLKTGDILGEASDFNQQVRFGDDVLTRIKLCSEDPSMLRKLQRVLVKRTIEPLLRRTLLEIKRPPSDLKCATVAGNTTMLHLFHGVDPSPMGQLPFTPAFLGRQIARWENSDFSETEFHLMPGASAYVGADVIAGVFASGLIYDDGPSLLVDIGTNGEIILKKEGKLTGCATAAGPAFEGAGLSCGMRGVDGAIERIRLKNNPFALSLAKIGQDGSTPPLGICGSAYIDFLGEARQTGLLSETGRFEQIPGTESFFTQDDGEKLALRISQGRAGHDILISEFDIARLLQAKAAIAAGVVTLLERENLKPSDIKTVYLAGGFGLHLSVRHTIGCGLFPGFTTKQVEVIGNSSLGGAYVALLDSNAMREIQSLATRVQVVELNQDPHFEDHYIDQLTLP